MNHSDKPKLVQLLSMKEHNEYLTLNWMKPLDEANRHLKVVVQYSYTVNEEDYESTVDVPPPHVYYSIKLMPNCSPVRYQLRAVNECGISGPATKGVYKFSTPTSI